MGLGESIKRIKTRCFYVQISQPPKSSKIVNYTPVLPCKYLSSVDNILSTIKLLESNVAWITCWNFFYHFVNYKTSRIKCGVNHVLKFFYQVMELLICLHWKIWRLKYAIVFEKSHSLKFLRLVWSNSQTRGRKEHKFFCFIFLWHSWISDLNFIRLWVGDLCSFQD